MKTKATISMIIILIILLANPCLQKITRTLNETEQKDDPVTSEVVNEESHHEGEESENHSEEAETEKSVPTGLLTRKKYMFKELDPENPEMNNKESIEHDEDGQSEMIEYLHIFEDYNYENIEKQMLKEKIELRLKSILKFYHLELEKIKADKTLNDSNVGPRLVGLFGEDFKKFHMDLKEIEISIKAALEKSIDMFFLYKCEDKVFHSSQDFHNCLNFKKDLKVFMMFQNFYEIGFYNKIHDLFAVRNYLSYIYTLIPYSIYLTNLCNYSYVAIDILQYKSNVHNLSNTHGLR